MTATRYLAAALFVAGLSLVARTDARDPADADPWPFLSTRAGYQIEIEQSEDKGSSRIAGIGFF